MHDANAALASKHATLKTGTQRQVRWVISALRNSFDWVSQAFRLFDPTESGSVKKEDLSAVLAQVGLETLPNELHQTFAFLGDFEERTEVSFKEFLIGLFLALTKDS